MTFADLLLKPNGRDSTGSRIFGVVIGIVTNNKDPDHMGRVKVKYPWLSDEDESFWARVVMPMAGKDRGMYFLPEVEDEVLIVFEHGDMRFPFVLGALWNGNDCPPANNKDGKNHVRMIKSRSGHVIRLNDEGGKETIEIVDKGQNSILFNTANNAISVTSQKDITLSATKGTITLDAQTITIKSSAQSTIEAGTGMDVKASSTMNIKGAMVNIN